MKKTLIALSMAAISLASCDTNSKGDKDVRDTDNDNPLLAEKFNTPFEAPPFDKITEDDYKPAFDKAIDLSRKEADIIANNADTATFSNTIEALEYSGRLLTKVSTVFFNVSSAAGSKNMQEITKEVAPLLSKLSDDIHLNKKLFTRVKYVWDNKDVFQLNDEQKMLLEKTYKRFVRSGANLNDEQQNQMRVINEKLSKLTVDYGNNGVNEVNEYKMTVSSLDSLKGLPNDLLEAAQSEDKKSWVFTLQNPSVMPFLQYAANRNLRKEIWTAYQNKGSQGKYDNSQILSDIASLRNEKARLLGYKSHADFVLEETMAKTPQNVYKLLDQLWKPALAMAKKEEATIKKMMEADGIKDAVQPYDWRYYAEKIRKEKYDLDEQAIKPYFSLNTVREGIFDLCKRLYGLQFAELNNVPKYHKDVTVWEVKEADGKHVGILYMDFHPREYKRPGAWMTSYRDEEILNGERVAPIISIVCNFTNPTQDAPALLTFDEATTFFHEFGHALHGLLANTQYPSLSGTSVSRDFVELPSQILENWAADSIMLKMYAKHYKTGEPIPDSLIVKMQNASTFDQGFATVEYLAASYLDLNYYTTADKVSDVTMFEKKAMDKIGLISSIIPRYKSGYFNHVFAGGYSAGYYSYIWSGVLDTDAYEAFKSTGDIFNAEKAKAFREHVLEKGGTVDPMELYKKFRGQEPSIEPLLKKRGLKEDPTKITSEKVTG